MEQAMFFDFARIWKKFKKLKKGLKQVMADLKVTDDKINALAASFSGLQTDILKALDDLKAAVGSSSGIPQSAVDALNAKIDAIQSMVTATDSSVKAADPGPASGSTGTVGP